MSAVVLGTSGRTAWTAVCHVADLVPERGAAALVGGEQVAVVRLVDGTVLAVQNLDPFSGAHVLSRGIVGSRGDAPTLASPMYKQVFDLRTGECLDPVGREPVAGGATLRTWPVRVEGGLVLVGTPLAAARADA
ncbi:nitrite reductase small subunit NirD [Actinotalea ferrariae]|uniref:nitrite reductase small subunit NirD n=1 Tax=Actinotalea ferrariae TaxID=1386098 RepID=UPI001C8CA918|nr:nitrite reductase small subunit NirD [Actinotalea ferrariae]MBX9246797.1 nitrite reductase small subunit NirD [Actinotalea ferrariae]